MPRSGFLASLRAAAAAKDNDATRDGMKGRRLAARAALALVAVLLLAACAPSSASSRTAAAATPSPTTAAHAPSAHAPSAHAGSAPTRIGPAQPGETLSIALLLHGRSPAELASLLAAINDPRSPLYHHYLTPAELAQRFGADPADVARASAALRAAGLTGIVPSPDGTQLDAQGTVAQLEALFGVALDAYRTADGRLAVAPESAPRIPPALASVATGVLGLDTRTTFRGGALFGPQSPALPRQSNPVGLTPSALASAYDLGTLHSAGLDGSGITVAVAEINTFRTSDVQAYDQVFGISPGPLQVISVNGGSTSVSPEPVLDIEVVRAVAPKAGVLVYEGKQDLLGVASTLARIVADNRAQIMSVSLGACERGLDPSTAKTFLGSLDSTFQRAAAQGMSVLVASGDAGAYDCQDSTLSVGAVAANPFVTAVGGTALYLNGNGSYGREAGWEGPLEGAGGGGGVSVYYQIPSWQTGPGVSNQFSDRTRQVPDVSAAADPTTGYAIYYHGAWQVVGGTSASTPLWASIIALADQQARSSGGAPLGFLNPALYRIGASASAGRVYHDVTIGGNLYYNATPQWDYSTGWGSPDAAQLVPALLSNR